MSAPEKVYPLDISEFARPNALSESDRKALEWLDLNCAGLSDWSAPRAIKAMLKDRREMAIRECVAVVDNLGESQVIDRAADALRALIAPKTKQVDVWHIEFAGATMRNPYIELADSEAEAQRQASKRRYEGASCIRVTGPHKQTIPAD